MMMLSSETDQKLKFQHPNNDNSSSGDSSRSSDEPVLKKHKLVSSLIPAQSDETIDTQLKRQDNYISGCRSEYRKGKRRRKQKTTIVNDERSKDSFKKTNKRAGENEAEVSCLLDDIKVCTKSFLEELKATSENLFIWMRQEMQKLMEVDANQHCIKREGDRSRQIVEVQDHQNKNESAIRPTENGTKEKPIQEGDRKERDDRSSEKSACGDQILHQLKPGKSISSHISNGKEKERFGLSVDPTRPTLLTGSPGLHVENLKTSSCSYGGNLLDMKKLDECERITQIGFSGICCLNQNMVSSLNSRHGFPSSLYQGLDGNISSISSQIAMENLPRENNLMGLKMSAGAIRFSEGTHGLSEYYAATDFLRHLNYQADSKLAAYQEEFPS